MRITKLEALALSKALHSLGLCRHTDDQTTDTLVGLAKKVDVYLLCGSEDDELAKDTTPKKGHGDVLKATFQVAPFNIEKEEPEEEHGSFVSGPDLHNLRQVTSDGDTLEFEFQPARARDLARVDLLHGGTCVVEDVSDLRRQGKKLLVRSHGDPETWSTFSVTKFSKDWISALPLDELVGVEA